MPKGDDDERQTLKPGYDIFYIEPPRNYVKPILKGQPRSVKVGN